MTAAPMTEAKPRVVLIDLSSLYWMNFHATAKDSASDAKNLTLQAVKRIQSEFPGLLAICLDSGRSFRYGLHAEYKAGRPEKTKASLEELDRTIERLRADAFLIWKADTFEGDDVIATATENARARGHEVLICSADKDLQQLVGMGVRQLRTHVWKEGGADMVRETFGVGPSQVRDFLALTGDSSDNIKGCPGCGPKTAAQLLKAFTNLEGLYTKLAVDERAVALAVGSNSQKPWELKIIQNLKASEKAVMLARQLVELRRDAPINFDDIYQERRLQPLTQFQEEPPQEQAAPEPSAPAREIPPEQTVAIGELIKEPPKEQRLTVVPPPPPSAFDRQLEPMSLKEAFWLATGMWESRLYQKFGGPHAIWAAMIRGREMAMPALASLDAFHVIEGKPCLTSNTIQVLAEKLPDCEYIRCTHTDDKYAEWETKHRKHPEPERLSYTIEEAVQAGLCGLEVVPYTPKPGEKDRRGNWDKRRKNMLRKTARDNLIRMVYPSAAALYSAEELGADID